MMTASDVDLVRQWFVEHLPADFYEQEPQVEVDRDEILVVGPISGQSSGQSGGGSGGPSAAELIAAHREATRPTRMELARRAQDVFGRKVSWGAQVGEETQLFTHVTAPVMTRLRMPERQLLDVLVEAGVARSRSEAVAWCVKLVGEREASWLGELHEALASVRRARTRGPGAGPDS